jgi:hypothetical protein
MQRHSGCAVCSSHVHESTEIGATAPIPPAVAHNRSHAPVGRELLEPGRGSPEPGARGPEEATTPILRPHP